MLSFAFSPEKRDNESEVIEMSGSILYIGKIAIIGVVIALYLSSPT